MGLLSFSISLQASRNIKKGRTVKLLGEKYKWFTIDEMKRSKMYSSNKETIDFVEANLL